MYDYNELNEQFQFMFEDINKNDLLVIFLLIITGYYTYTL